MNMNAKMSNVHVKLYDKFIAIKANKNSQNK